MKLAGWFAPLVRWKRSTRKQPARVEPAGSEPDPPPRPIPARPDLILTPFLASSDMPVSFVDPGAADQPLIHVNDAFCQLTGYARDDCVGHNCRFLQGRLTRRSEADTIRQGIDAERYLITRLLNYRCNGELFDNVVQIGQLRDTRGAVRYLFGLQWDVTETLKRLDANAEIDLVDRTLSPPLRMLERLANHLVRRSTAIGEGAAGVPLVERLVAMSRPYQFPTPDLRPDRAVLSELLGYLLRPHAATTRQSPRLNGAQGSFDYDVVGCLALWLHELAVAASASGGLSDRGGGVTLSWGFPRERGRPMIAFHWLENTVAGPPDSHRIYPFAVSNRIGGNGAQLVREVVQFAGGRALIRSHANTLEATLVLPNL